MNHIERARQDAEIIWARLPKNYQEKVRAQAERLHGFLDRLRDTVEDEEDMEWLEDAVE